MGTTDWMTAVAVLAGGVIAGVMLIRHIVLAGRRASPEGAPSAARADLEAKRDALLQQLRELDDTASKLDPEEAARQRAHIEIEAATVLRDLDRVPSAGAPPAPAPARPSSAIAGFVWGTAATLVIVGIILFASRSATERGASGSLTGNLPNEAQQPAPDDLAALEAMVARNPDDLDARLDLAQAQLFRENLLEVAKQSSFVLDRAPNHPRALAYQAFVRMAMGDEQAAVSLLERALAADPNLLDGWIYLALVRMRLGEPDKAVEAIEEAKRRHPADAAMLDQLLAEMQSRASTETATAPAQAAAGASVSGIITLDASRDAAANRGKVIFVIARPMGASSGPPLAVRRLVATSFPLAFTLGEGDSMMGQPLPREFRIDARIDSDGNAMTSEAADPAGALERVALGATDLRLVLR